MGIRQRSHCLDLSPSPSDSAAPRAAGAALVRTFASCARAACTPTGMATACQLPSSMAAMSSHRTRHAAFSSPQILSRSSPLYTCPNSVLMNVHTADHESVVAPPCSPAPSAATCPDLHSAASEARTSSGTPSSSQSRACRCCMSSRNTTHWSSSCLHTASASSSLRPDPTMVANTQAATVLARRRCFTTPLPSPAPAACRTRSSRRSAALPAITGRDCADGPSATASSGMDATSSSAATPLPAK
mmetsp:Transcript_13539/g.34553  ORF Transcript_13539/g.34553 Transcript_13539/m.34553 type:complete len:245 (-) Transcript_13539:964-1698(-)